MSTTSNRNRRHRYDHGQSGHQHPEHALTTHPTSHHVNTTPSRARNHTTLARQRDLDAQTIDCPLNLPWVTRPSPDPGGPGDVRRASLSDGLLGPPVSRFARPFRALRRYSSGRASPTSIFVALRSRRLGGSRDAGRRWRSCRRSGAAARDSAIPRVRPKRRRRLHPRRHDPFARRAATRSTSIARSQSRHCAHDVQRAPGAVCPGARSMELAN